MSQFFTLALDSSLASRSYFPFGPSLPHVCCLCPSPWPCFVPSSTPALPPGASSPRCAGSHPLIHTMCHSSLLLVCAVLHPYFPPFSFILEVSSNWNNSMIPVPLDEVSAQANLFELFITIRQQQSSGEKGTLDLFGENQGACGQSRGKAEKAAELLLGRVELWGRLCCKVCFTPPPLPGSLAMR